MASEYCESEKDEKGCNSSFTNDEHKIQTVRESLKEVIDGSGDQYRIGLLRNVIRGEGFVGEGAEKTVFDNPYREGQLCAIYRYPRDSATMKSRYYLNKVLHLLFPKHIPDIHLATTAPPSIIVDEVKESQNTLSRIFNIIRKPFSARMLEYRLYRLGVGVDPSDPNFIFNKNGLINYIDNPINYDIDALRRAVKNKLKSGEQSQALDYISRLEKISGKYGFGIQDPVLPKDGNRTIMDAP
ncbi:MAG TPA: hypothetical protein PK263_03015 [bacterium]|nr:hypothetical protein [bacterium]